MQITVMNDIYDLTQIINMEEFPFHEMATGISKSLKRASVYYGVTTPIESLNREQSAWYYALTNSTPLKGLDIHITQPVDDLWSQAWYRLDDGSFWKSNYNTQFFPNLQSWIKNQNIFSETGRQIVFIQLQYACTPAHEDQNLINAPEEFRNNREFIWITSPVKGKKLFVNKKAAPYVCWFNSYLTHYTMLEDGLRWSLRIDGKFTQAFKNKIINNQ